MTRHRQNPTQKSTVETEATVPDDHEAGRVAGDDHDTRSQTVRKEEDDDKTSKDGEQNASDQKLAKRAHSTTRRGREKPQWRRCC